MQNVLTAVTSVTYVIIYLVAELQFVQCERAINSCQITTRIGRPAKRCETIDEIIVELKEYSPKDDSRKVETWCIIINVDYDLYDSQILEIELVGHPFAVGYSTINFMKFITNGVQLSTTKGQNIVALFSHDTTKPLAVIKSIKLGGKPLCELRQGRLRSAYTDNNETSLEKAEFHRDDENRFLNHCKEMSAKLEFKSYCPGLNIPGSVFMVDKLTLNRESYWCLNFNALGEQKELKVFLSNPYCSSSWNNNAGQRTVGRLRTFLIGKMPTTIVFSPKAPAQVPDLQVMSVEGIPICDYFKDIRVHQK